MPPLSHVKDGLRTLNLGRNLLNDVPAEYFYGFVVLSIIQIYANKLTAVPDIRPLNATLKVLDLSSNEIESLEPFLSNTIFPKLHRLDVTDNKIGYLSSGMISCWPRLLALNFGNNLLKSLEDLSVVTRRSLLKVLHDFR